MRQPGVPRLLALERLLLQVLPPRRLSLRIRLLLAQALLPLSQQRQAQALYQSQLHSSCR